mgnify:FL=1
MQPLHKELADLRGDPSTDLPTLRKVADVLARHAGARVTIGAGRARQSRLQQAQVIAADCATQAEAVRRLSGALGVSASTGYRYAKTVRIGRGQRGT